MSDGDRVTQLTRAYRGDVAYIARTARKWAAERNEKVNGPDVIHAAVALLRAQERERG